MPLFEYRCQACAHLEEVLQKHTDPAPESCPACGKPGTMAKAISLTSFQLKGGGWYKDLYASSSSKPDATGAASTNAASTGASSPPAGGDSSAPSAGAATNAASPSTSSKPAESKPAAPAASTSATTTST